MIQFQSQFESFPKITSNFNNKITQTKKIPNIINLFKKHNFFKFKNMNPYSTKDIPTDQQKTLSVSSFYPQTQLKPHSFKMVNFSFTDQQHFEEKQFQSSLKYLFSEISIKKQQISKVQLETQSDIQRMQKELISLQSTINASLKHKHKDEIIKNWAKNIQNTIVENIRSRREAQRLLEDKIQQKIKSIENDVEKVEKSVKQEKKQRQTSWEENIDDLGETIMNFEEIIRVDAESSMEKIFQIQSDLEQLEENIKNKLQGEKRKSAEEFKNIFSLIDSVTHKLIL